MAKTLTYVQKGQYKDLSDIVTNITPDETPFISMIGSGTATNVLFNWTEEELEAAAVNAQIEGADAPAATDNILSERSNYTQIFSKTVSLSGSSQKNRLAGDVQEMAHQVTLRAKALKIDMEYAFVGLSQVATAGSSVAGRLTASFKAQTDAGNIVDAASAKVTQDMLDDALLKLYEAGGTPSVVMCHPRLRNALIADINAKDVNQIQRDIGANGTHVNNNVVTYTSTAGFTVRLVPNRHAEYDSSTGVGSIFIFDPAMWSVEYLRPYALSDLAKTGDADSKLLVVECGLKNRNFKSAACIINAKI